MVHRAIALEGTCSGEHGVGLGKVEYLESELGEGTVGLMETIKRTGEFFLFLFTKPKAGGLRREERTDRSQARRKDR
jgi:hypothetical protein